MILHGVSHAAVSLVSVVAAGIIAESLAAQLPYLLEALHQYVSPLLNEVGLKVDTWQLLKISVVILLGFIWGVSFKAANSR